MNKKALLVRPTRRRILLTGLAAPGAGLLAAPGAGLLAALAPATAAAQVAGWPSRPIRLIVGFGAGGATDLVARAVAQKLHEQLGQPVVVENKPGASSNIGTEEAARAPADGQTLFLLTIANATNMSYFRALKVDTLRDFVPVSQIMAAPSILVAAPSLGVTDLKSLIALAKSQPGKLTFASSGPGGSPHLAGEMLKQRAGIDMIHVPYKGAAQALTDVLSGNVSIGFKTALSAMPHMQAGRLVPLAVASGKRMAQLPQVPTMAEAGLADFEVSSWNGLAVPAGTPDPIVRRLAQAMDVALNAADVRKQFAEQGGEAVASTPEAFRAYIAREIEKWRQVIEVAGIERI